MRLKGELYHKMHFENLFKRNDRNGKVLGLYRTNNVDENFMNYLSDLVKKLFFLSLRF